jgi:hypothetical protein
MLSLLLASLFYKTPIIIWSRYRVHTGIVGLQKSRKHRNQHGCKLEIVGEEVSSLDSCLQIKRETRKYVALVLWKLETPNAACCGMFGGIC